MKPIRTIVIDDEPLARRGIRQLLSPHDDIEVVAEARNGKEAVRLLKTIPADLVFLDVQMPELDGFAVLRQLDADRLPAVIFVTAYDTFAVRAFEAHALDYLIKPVHEARFEVALKSARERLLSKEILEMSRKLAHSISTSAFGALPAAAKSAKTQRFLISGRRGDVIVEDREIEWIEAADYYVAVHIGRRRHLMRDSLRSLEGRLDPMRFVRIHRSAIVNLAHARAVRATLLGQSILILRDGTRLPLSRRRRAQIADAMRQFTGGC
jgi:two-component system, LytTR family, response regulator